MKSSLAEYDEIDSAWIEEQQLVYRNVKTIFKNQSSCNQYTITAIEYRKLALQPEEPLRCS